MFSNFKKTIMRIVRLFPSAILGSRYGSSGQPFDYDSRKREFESQFETFICFSYQLEYQFRDNNLHLNVESIKYKVKKDLKEFKCTSS